MIMKWSNQINWNIFAFTCHSAISVSFSQNPRLLDDVSFHPCVRFKRWEAERILSFIPPDGNFRLLSYHVSSQKSVFYHFMPHPGKCQKKLYCLLWLLFVGLLLPQPGGDPSVRQAQHHLPRGKLTGTFWLDSGPQTDHGQGCGVGPSQQPAAPGSPQCQPQPLSGNIHFWSSHKGKHMAQKLQVSK